MPERLQEKLRDPKVAIPSGMLISNIGNGMYLLAVSVVLYRDSGSSAMFAWLLVYQAVAVLGMQVFASVGADRGHAQRLAVAAEICRAVLVGSGAFAATLGYSSALVLIGILLSLVQPFFRTSIFKIGPLIADGESLARYNARTSTFQQLGQFAGAAAAGALMGVWLYLPLWINAVSYLASAFFTGVCVIGHQEIGVKWRTLIPRMFHPSRALFEWIEAMRYVLRSPIILGVCTIAAFDLVFVNIINVSYAPMLARLDLRDTWISVWDVCFAAGAIIGVNLFGRLVVLQTKWWVLGLCLAVESVLSIYLIVTLPWLIGLLMVPIGVINSISTSAFSFYLQTHCRKDMIGRIAGVRQFCLTALSALLIGWLSRGIDAHASLGFLRLSVTLGVSALAITLLFLVFGRRGTAG